jgi:hypothetical protein
MNLGDRDGDGDGDAADGDDSAGATPGRVTWPFPRFRAASSVTPWASCGCLTPAAMRRGQVVRTDTLLWSSLVT